MERWRNSCIGALLALLVSACAQVSNMGLPAVRVQDPSLLPESARRAGDPARTPITGSSNRAALLVPLYTDFGPAWTALIAAKRAHPTAAIAAIINPSNGPGAGRNGTYTTGITALSTAGIGVYGYVYTSYGARPLADVEAEVDRYAAWYAPSGLFIDNLANVTGSESYYVALRAHAKSVGITLTIGNAGAPVAPTYSSAADVIITYEATGWPLAANGSNPTVSRSAFISLGVPFDAAKLAVASAGSAFFYATDRDGANPYGALPTYIDALALAAAR